MSISNQVRTRFAPSPTGFVHVGNFRTALFAYLFARHNNGVFVYRVEDTDQARKVEGAVENLIQVFATMGIEFDEGPRIQKGQVIEVGEHGPYVQSKRLSIYKDHAQQLVDQGKAYYCFCSPQRLDELRKEQTALKKPPMYDGLCRNLSAEELQTKLNEFQKNGQSPVIRQAVPKNGKTIVKDLVYGEIIYDHEQLDDQVLLKSDGFPTYHLAVVVDDHLMKITHVIRADEWIPSTPKHILLYEAFDWEVPYFAHLPLILNPDKTKLSKRQGDVAVEDYLAKGYLPEALLNFVALLGWNPKTEQEIFSKDELIQQFELNKVNKSGSVFDIAKLDWMNAQYIRQLSNHELLEKISPFLASAEVDLAKYSEDYLLAVVSLEKDRLKSLGEITQNKDIFFGEIEYEPELLVWKKADKTDAKEKLIAIKKLLETILESNLDLQEVEQRIKDWITGQGYENGNVLWPLRVALSGQERSPSPFELVWCLQKQNQGSVVLRRIEQAIEKLA